MKEKYKFLLLGLLLLPCWGISLRFHVDLDTLYHTAKLIPDRLAAIYGYSGGPGRYFYGPVSLVLIAPLGKLSFPTAHFLWTALQTASYVLFWIAMYRLYPFLREERTRWAWLAVWILAINPIHNNFQSGNIQLMLAVLLFASAAWVGRGALSSFGGGVLSAFAAAVKVFPLFLVAYQWFTAPKAYRVGVALGLGLCFGIPVLAFGLPATLLLFRSFFTGLLSYSADNSLTRTPDILCLPSFIARTLSPGKEPGPEIAWIIKGAIGLCSAAFFALVLWRTQRGLQGRERLHLWALASALMVFLNPSTRPHYFIFLVPALASSLELARNFAAAERYALQGVLTLALAFISFTAEGVAGKALNDKWELWGVPTVGICLLAFGAFWAIARTYGYGRLFVTLTERQSGYAQPRSSAHAP